MKIWKVNTYSFLFIDNYHRTIEKEKGIKWNLKQVGECMLGQRLMFLHSEGSENITDKELCTVLHNKELWLLRDMQYLFNLYFSNNYI